MAAAGDFAKLVPGFDFLQGLMKNAGSALPGMSQWIAPTLDPEELEKRIEELRTVQFWLEQNARMLGATIQALEVQRMTLSTLKTMNLPVAAVAEAFKIKSPVAEPAAAATARPAPRRAAPKGSRQGASPESAPAPAAGLVDPTQWWGALTKQFTQLAASALKDSTTDAAKNLAGTMVKQSFDAAGQTLKAAAGAPAKVAARAAAVARPKRRR